ncbi:hypothetical protein MJT46_005166 [Ovis ammon polii x Ovis aries]|nr:hypothetical protein MJT46_005166 [Ovis ammon polii x Ovis aries]
MKLTTSNCWKLHTKEKLETAGENGSSKRRKQQNQGGADEPFPHGYKQDRRHCGRKSPREENAGPPVYEAAPPKGTGRQTATNCGETPSPQMEMPEALL